MVGAKEDGSGSEQDAVGDEEGVEQRQLRR
jgi:hypothetical protein